MIYTVGVLKDRLKIPEACPRALSQLMRDCWRIEPNRRPAFTDILRLLKVS